jgi:phosphohistidine phosphatase
MKLILVRHGLAAERELFERQNKDESQRPLVIKGRKRSQVMAVELKSWIQDVDLLVSSPYLRAKQTAELFRQSLVPKKYFESIELIPSAPPMAFAGWLRSNAALATKVVVVGHSPQLDLFASWCLSGRLESFIEIKKSGILGLEIESFHDFKPGHAELRFLVSPKMFD